MNRAALTFENLQTWATDTLKDDSASGQIDVLFAFPDSQPQHDSVLFALIGIDPQLNHTIEYKQIRLTYLVSAWSADPMQVQRLLAGLAFAALERQDFEVRTVPDGLWAALGVPLRPAFLLHCPVRQELPRRTTKLVMHPLVLHHSPTTGLFGQVMGPGEIPLAGAHVTFLDMACDTDAKGRFSFRMIPAGVEKRLQIEARGKTLTVAVKEPTSPDTPLTVYFDPTQQGE